MPIWTQSEAVALCVAIEAICPKYGCHVALTGGCLYGKESRKDCDILLYRIRQCPKIKLDELWDAFRTIGLNQISGFGWCYKLEYNGKPVDCFFPEEQAGEYNAETEHNTP